MPLTGPGPDGLPESARPHSPGAIPDARLQPPRTTSRLVPRDALLARLLAARRQRCVIIQGPAGSGKTTTLAAWRKALMSLDFDVAWLSLAPEDDEPVRFLDCLRASLVECGAGDARDASLPTGPEAGACAIEERVIMLVQAIVRRQREVVVMLDNLHYLDDAGVFQALQLLLDYAPPTLHFALTSRTAVPLSVSRLRAQGLLAEFDLRDLRFSAGESERFLRERLGDIDGREARALHTLTDGWVAGLQLIAPERRGGTGGTHAELRGAAALNGYFEREVLARLDAADCDLLTRVAACNRVCAPLCAALPGLQEGEAQLAARLRGLARDSLLMLEGEGRHGEPWYRLHPLLREVLLARLRAWPDAVLQAMHRAAWRWFEAAGHVDDAVRHAVEAGEQQVAADMVVDRAQDLMEGGRLKQLAVLMRGLRPCDVQARIALRLVRGHLQLHARELDALAQGLDALEAEPLGARQRYDVVLLRAGLAMQRDDTDAVSAILPALQAIPEGAQAHAFLGRAHVLAWHCMYRGEHARARAVLDDAAGRGATPGQAPAGRCLEGMSLALQGRIVDAERILLDVLHEAEGQGDAGEGVARIAAGLLGETLYELNDLDGACRVLEDRIEGIVRGGIPDIVLRALMVLSSCHWLAGRHAQALARLDQLEDYATRHGLDRPLAYVLGVRLRWHLKRADMDAADAVHGRLLALGARHDHARAGIGAEVHRCAERARADMCMHWNDFDGAVAVLRPLIARTEAAGRGRVVPALHLQLALADQERGRADAARWHALEALRLGHRLGLRRSLLDAAAGVPALLERLLRDDALDPVLAFYAQRLLAEAADIRARRVKLPAASTQGPDAFSERELEVLSLVAQAMPNKKIARILGITPRTVKWHLSKVYGKLGVAERDEAVARMRDYATTHGAAL
ncbi:AAA family ATPase [Cupriavidus necator]|uniref:LuxR family transcriptional regulator n=1 Tax=Cupriavidus necator TaxID=106590 RepID=A0A367PI47_CUPNE|nr:AAA family ATPase [Cupriavidus necator]RCJ07549.1 LuxR family transcriptional regulator [Cupriavidus necator]